MIGPVEAAYPSGYLADELTWGLEHGSEGYAVLNAGRAQIFLADDKVVSKIQGGSIALARGLGPPVVLRRALDQQQGQAPEQAVAQDAADYILAVAAALHSAAAEAGRPGSNAGRPAAGPAAAAGGTGGTGVMHPPGPAALRRSPGGMDEPMGP